MMGKAMKRNGCQLVLFTFALLCITLGTSFTFNPIRALNIRLNNKHSIAIRSGNSNFLQSLIIKELSLKSSTNLAAQQTKAPVPFLNIANILTIARVLLIPFFMLSFVMRKKSIGVLIYVVSCLTDFLDGFIARKFNLTSPFGAFLDPVADKLMVATALIMLVCQLPTWWFACPVALIMCREIGVSALREWMAERGQRNSVQVGNLGKIKTTTQMISTAMLLEACPGASDFDIAVSLGISRPLLFSAGVVLLYIATALTVISGIQYLVVAWPVLTENPAAASVEKTESNNDNKDNGVYTPPAFEG